MKSKITVTFGEHMVNVHVKGMHKTFQQAFEAADWDHVSTATRTRYAVPIKNEDQVKAVVRSVFDEDQIEWVEDRTDFSDMQREATFNARVGMVFQITDSSGNKTARPW